MAFIDVLIAGDVDGEFWDVAKQLSECFGIRSLTSPDMKRPLSMLASQIDKLDKTSKFMHNLVEGITVVFWTCRFTLPVICFRKDATEGYPLAAARRACRPSYIPCQPALRLCRAHWKLGHTDLAFSHIGESRLLCCS